MVGTRVGLLVALGFIASLVPAPAWAQYGCRSNADCNDYNACTDDFCDPYYYACYYNPRRCDDGNACSDDSCDPATGCVFTPDDTNPCTDNDPCTPGDRCSGGACIGEDGDGDGVGDICDDCTTVADPDQTDTDNDGRGDACDACPFDPLDDADADGVCGDADACPNSNVGLRVMVGGCNSGVPNTMTPPGSGCMLQDVVNACGVGVRNHGEFASCVARLAGDLNTQGVLTGRQKGRIQQCAARSNAALREAIRRF